MRDDSYAYELAYPESMGGAVFYVGKGSRNRILEHELEARRGHHCKRCEIIRAIQSTGEQVVKRKIRENLLEIDALILERDLIELYGYDTLANKQRGHKNPSPRKVPPKIIGYRTYSYQKNGLFFQDSEPIYEDVGTQRPWRP